MPQAQNVSESSLNEYVAECDELLGRISGTLEKVGKAALTVEDWNSIYRDVHSMKGSSFLLGFTVAGELAHAFEAALEPFRQGDSTLSPAGLDLLYRFVDLFGDMVRAAASGSGRDFGVEKDSLLRDMSSWAPTGSAGVSLGHELEDAGISTAPAGTAHLRLVEPKIEAQVEAPPEQAPEQTPETAKESMSTIRVPVGLLDKMMTLMGEMVLVRNQVLQFATRNDSLEFLNLSQRLDAVTGELQGEMMKTRMQPIGSVLSKFQRVVRDLSRDLGKEIELQLSGTETELDRTLLETIKDPLTHIIRNSCDHGIETPAERAKSGKSRQGVIAVRSYHEGGQVIIEVADNGRGLNREKLIAKAIEKGLLSPERGAALSDREALNLIFLPGFSTAAQVTNVSGRGVGMDVVRSNIEKIGGLVELASQVGKGTNIRLKIPLTLAIVPAMIVRCAEDRYAIPQVKLVELVRAEVGAKNGVEYLQGKPVYRLRGKLLPLVDLKGVLKFGASSAQGNANEGAPEAVNIVVLNAENRLFGMIVDEIQDTADIVVKPLSRFLKSLAVYSGATVLGDGSVAFILDVLGIAQREGLMKEAGEEIRETKESDSDAATAKLARAREYLLIGLDAPARYSIPLSQVHRLEEFKREQVEYSGSQRVARYRDSLLPLISLNEELGFRAASVDTMTSALQVVVIKRDDRLFGLEVNEILDVVSTEALLDRTLTDRAGIQGNLVTGTEVIVVVDTDAVLTQTAQRLTGGKSEGSQARNPKTASGKNDPRRAAVRVLFADDTAFFRKHVSRVLEEAGYRVDVAEDGEDALNRLSRETYQVVLSDIEMPKKNGYQLATQIRKDSRWPGIPLVALTTRSEPAARDAGMRAGFDRYLEKMNPVELLQALDELTLKGGEQ